MTDLLINVDPKPIKEIYKPLASSDELKSKFELVDVLDKGSSAALVLNGNKCSCNLYSFCIFIYGVFFSYSSGNFR
jgi:hypothetical protein